MDQLFARISTYNIFNYLLPGILFAVIGDALTSYDLILENILIGVFVYYFFGLVISRLGSLVIEPPLRRFGFLTFSNYPDFVKASAKDQKIELLSEVNNMYRTLCSLVVILVGMKGYEYAEATGWVPSHLRWWLLFPSLLALFLFAYRKQTAYVSKRVAANLDSGTSTDGAT